jgi:hypothetical protein
VRRERGVCTIREGDNRSEKGEVEERIPGDKAWAMGFLCIVPVI